MSWPVGWMPALSLHRSPGSRYLPWQKGRTLSSTDDNGNGAAGIRGSEVDTLHHPVMNYPPARVCLGSLWSITFTVARPVAE